MKISHFSIRRPVFTTVTMFLILILGVVSLTRIPLKLIPDLNPPVGVVVTTYQGAGPTEVVEKVTKPLEQSLATLPGIQDITSTSQEGSNFILLEFSWSTSIDEIQNEVLQRIDQAPLPDDAEKPRFLKFDPAQFPIIQVSLESDKEEELNELAEELQLELTRVEGVANVNVSGSFGEEIRIELDQDALEENQLTQQDVVSVIGANNVSMPGDSIISDGKSLTTRILSELTTTSDIENIILLKNPVTNEDITIKDIGTVTLQEEELQSITRSNQNPSVLLSVLQESDANTADVSDRFQEELSLLLEEDRFQSVKSDIIFDQGDYIQVAIGNITNTLLLGGTFAMLVLFLFLRNIKSPLIIGVAIPYSVIVTFVLMYFSDFALNIMTLGALALGIGMLVDNAIVVIENIYRHLSMGKDPKEAAKDGAKEVGAAITASTFTTIAVFLPVVFITGIIGELFTEFALTISFSLFASLIVALTVIPMLASIWLKPIKGDFETTRRRSKGFNRLERSIKWVLHHRFIVFLLTTLLLVASGFGLTRVGTQFLPATDEGFFTISVELENGTALPRTEEVVRKLEEVLEKQEAIDLYVSLIGSTQERSFQGTGQSNIAELYVNLVPLEERDISIFKFADELKEELEPVLLEEQEGASLSFNLQSTSGTSPQSLSFTVQDLNKERLDAGAMKLVDRLQEVEGITSVSTNQMEKIEEVQMTIDRDEVVNKGLTPAAVANVVNTVTRGVTATQIVSDTSDVIPVVVQYDAEIMEDVNALKNLKLKTPSAGYITLDEIAKIQTKEGPVSIDRINQQDAVEFSLTYEATLDLGTISSRVDEAIASLELPSQTLIKFGGDRELLEDSIDDMVMAIILAIVLVYIVMSAQFESFKYPFVIMFTVPLMIIGVSFALLITNTEISITSIIGVIVLAGIVVNNAIVIVDYINQRKASGMNSYDAIVESVKDRARPIFMTAATTILGLLPLAIGIGEGTEINQPMGITVIGGLLSSTLLTLYIIPAVYSLVDKDTRSMKKWKNQ
ncbi:cation transporter [Bacillus coahuilensis p1.1.43]|uniref:Cation transporter n=1 Tax=Bacillus coahuilensis p1.1.43 TaxID=1150625 RepID=A0A147KAD0_9BACI|nr:efflux RND transporter permease subunit [Bacillus coahuilensis]KUP07588.1 cation transporter [Bacillus coahuilensis p1.1.43]